MTKLAGWMKFYEKSNKYPMDHGLEWVFSCYANSKGATSYERRYEVKLSSLPAFADFVESLGLSCIQDSIFSFYGNSTKFYANDDTVVYTSRTDEKEKVCVIAYTIDEKIERALTNFWSEHKYVKSTDSISMPMIDEDGKLSFVTLGAPISKAVYEPSNYDESVNAQFDFVVKELNKTTEPAGRLVVIQGPAGTGKSFLVRSLISSLNSKHLLFPSALATNLDSPTFYPKLIEEKSQSESDSLTIFIEDGDEYLMHRDESNRSKVSTILNLCDGLLAVHLNCRIIITSNTPEEAMDPAITREGRLLSFINVGALEPAQANAVFQRISGSPGSYTDKTTLAKVYSDAKKTGFTPVEKTRTKTGFVR